MFGSRSVLPEAAFRADLVKRKVDQLKNSQNSKAPTRSAALPDATVQERSQ